MNKLSYRDAVSRTIARAVDAYYQSSPGGREAELVGRVFQEYLDHFRRVLWGSENVTDFLAAVEGTIGPLSDWVRKDLL
ncbi:MAG: hypothetical protein ACPLRU_01165 [Desulfofundulus sp.]